MIIELKHGLEGFWGGEASFDSILNVKGKIFRAHKNRKTLYIEKNGKGYFIKIHRRIGWKEIFKNLLSLRWPIVTARNELRAIKKLEELGIETMTVAGFGERGIPPAWLESFIITEELKNTISLEEFTRDWKHRPPDIHLKRALIKKVAFIANCLHTHGVNHRDFYICHFLIDIDSINKKSPEEEPRLYLIDLHRVQLRKHTPRRWKIKDLAGLYFSSMDIGLTRRDIFRFMKIYSGKPLRNILKDNAEFWELVRRRAVRLYEKDFQRSPDPLI